MVLVKGSRAQAALVAANQAVERGERIAVRLTDSLRLLRSSRDELASKMRADTAVALSHQNADPQIEVAVPPAPSLRQWIFLEQSRAAYQAQRAGSNLPRREDSILSSRLDAE
jgi:hypothetical protein